MFSPLELYMKERIAYLLQDIEFQIKMLLMPDYSKDAGRENNLFENTNKLVIGE